MSGTLVKQVLLQGGYFPDRFAQEGRGPDVFFMQYEVPLWVLQGVSERGDESAPTVLLWEQVSEMGYDIMDAIMEKYHRKVPPWEDVFWECSTRITKVE